MQQPKDHPFNKRIETRDSVEDYEPNASNLYEDCEDCENRETPCPACSERQFLAILELRRN